MSTLACPGEQTAIHRQRRVRRDPTPEILFDEVERQAIFPPGYGHRAYAAFRNGRHLDRPGFQQPRHRVYDAHLSAAKVDAEARDAGSMPPPVRVNGGRSGSSGVVAHPASTTAVMKVRRYAASWRSATAGCAWRGCVAACAGACSGAGLFRSHSGRTAHTRAGYAPNARDQPTSGFPEAAASPLLRRAALQ
jgi:hypothetical protein